AALAVVEVPIRQHPARAALFAMAGGPVCMAVDNRRGAGLLEERRDAFVGHVVARRDGPRTVLVAGAAHALGERLAPSVRPQQKQPLREAVARDAAKTQIAMIVGALAVAVRERDPRAERGDDERVWQPDRAGRLHEALAQQEVAIAVHHVERDAA